MHFLEPLKVFIKPNFLLLDSVMVDFVEIPLLSESFKSGP